MCALLGAPVAHSLSPAMHNAAFSYLGLDLTYVALHVEPPELRAAIAGARSLGFVGLNLTAPHKEAAMACCEPDEHARAVGAVNTLLFEQTTTRGSNTDTDGLAQAIATACPHGVRHALILGAGGAARAAAYVLDRADAEVTVAARRSRCLKIGETEHEVQTLRELAPALLHEIDLVIDATPVGLGEAAPLIDVALLPADAVVIDLSVRPSTALSRAAMARGLRAQLGDEMLLHQGARAFSLFTGRAAPLAEMRAALDPRPRVQRTEAR